MSAPLPPALAALSTPPDAHSLSMRQWQTKMQQAKLDKVTLDSLVMNWLVVEGYQHVAEQFEQEAQIKSRTQGIGHSGGGGGGGSDGISIGLSMTENGSHRLIHVMRSVPLSSIAARTNVRMSLSQGRIEEARAQIDRLLPELLESRPALLLQLQQQQLVELIRADRIDEALSFARSHLRAASADDPSSLSALETIMSLLAFAPLPAAQNPAAHLLDQRARAVLAQSVNDAILDGQFASSESTLQRAAKQAMHAQKQLAHFMHTFPQLPLDAAAAAPSAGHSSAATRAAASGAGSGSLASSAALLDPASVFESLAQSEAAARKASEEAAAAELAQVVAALERQRREKEQLDQVRRARQTAVTAARAAASRASYRRDSSSQEEEEEEEEEEPEEEEEEHGEEHDEDEEESDDEDHNMAHFV